MGVRTTLGLHATSPARGLASGRDGWRCVGPHWHGAYLDGVVEFDDVIQIDTEFHHRRLPEGVAHMAPRPGTMPVHRLEPREVALPKNLARKWAVGPTCGADMRHGWDHAAVETLEPRLLHRGRATVEVDRPAATAAGEASQAFKGVRWSIFSASCPR